jgi:hypothetical protein
MTENQSRVTDFQCLETFGPMSGDRFATNAEWFSVSGGPPAEDGDLQRVLGDLQEGVGDTREVSGDPRKLQVSRRRRVGCQERPGTRATRLEEVFASHYAAIT